MEPATLATRRLLLRPVGLQDADAVYAACQDPDIQRWTTIPSPYLREHAERFVGQLVPDGWRDGTMFTFGVFAQEAARAPSVPEKLEVPEVVAVRDAPKVTSVPEATQVPQGAHVPEVTEVPYAPARGKAAETWEVRGAPVPDMPLSPDTRAVREGGTLVAMLGLSLLGLGTAEIGFWAAKDYRGRGYVSEAVGAVVHWAFTRAGIDRVEWRAEVGNARSRAVAEKAGFTVEGILRSAIAHRDIRRDCWVGALLPSDLGLPSTAPYLPSTGA